MSYLYAKPSLSIFFLGTSAKIHKTYKHRLSGLFGKESATAISRDSKSGWRNGALKTQSSMERQHITASRHKSLLGEH